MSANAGTNTESDVVVTLLERVVALLEEIRASLARIEERQQGANALLEHLDRSQWS